MTTLEKLKHLYRLKNSQGVSPAEPCGSPLWKPGDFYQLYAGYGDDDIPEAKDSFDLFFVELLNAWPRLEKLLELCSAPLIDLKKVFTVMEQLNDPA